MKMDSTESHASLKGHCKLDQARSHFERKDIPKIEECIFSFYPSFERTFAPVCSSKVISVSLCGRI